MRLFVRHLAEVVVPIGVKNGFTTQHESELDLKRSQVQSVSARLMRDAKQATDAATLEARGQAHGQGMVETKSKTLNEKSQPNNFE